MAAAAATDVYHGMYLYITATTNAHMARTKIVRNVIVLNVYVRTGKWRRGTMCAAGNGKSSRQLQ